MINIYILFFLYFLVLSGPRILGRFEWKTYVVPTLLCILENINLIWWFDVWTRLIDYVYYYFFNNTSYIPLIYKNKVVLTN